MADPRRPHPQRIHLGLALPGVHLLCSALLAAAPPTEAPPRTISAAQPPSVQVQPQPAPPPGAPVSPLQPPRPEAPPPPQDPVQRVRWLNQRIDELLSTSPAGRAQIGVAVLDIESGRLLYSRNDGLRLNPASNVKLLTTAAALAQLGPEYRFKTALYIDRDHRTSERANLYLRGFGDPALQVEDLWRLSAELSQKGVRRISGDIVIDDTFFDDQRVGPGFEQKNEDAAFRAPQGAVSLGYNAVGIRVLPGPSEGAPARVVLDPSSPYFVVMNQSRTTTSRNTSLLVETHEAQDGEHTVVRVRGTIRLGEGAQEHVKRVVHPDLYAGYTLRDLIQRRGIRVLGKIARGAVPAEAQLVATHSSPPLGVLVREINKRSNNFMTEQVLKALGAEVFGKPGTWRKGVDAVARYLDTIGIPAGRYVMTNGSGLYDANRFTAAQIAQVLRSAYRDFRYAADFVGSLGVAGAEGTISHRMSGGLAERYVRAKTGTLLGVSCLSGYASAPIQPGQPARGPLAFSVLINQLPDDGGAAARQLQDAIAETLVVYLGATPEAKIGANP